MSPRSSRLLEVLRETIEQAESMPGLGPHDPGVIQLRRIFSRWSAENEATGGQLAADFSGTPPDASHKKQ